jgi:hypothetical protein
MSTVTISKEAYESLLTTRERYEYLRGIVQEDIFLPPPVRSRKQVMKEFRATKKYSPAFLKDLEEGLKRSSYFTA